jgi:thymidylate synthase
MGFEAIYKSESTSSNQLIMGNPESNTAIVTLWTKAKEIANRLDSSKYCVMGQLFSAERGLDLLVRNLLANPQITNLVITGVDFSKSGIVLMDFFQKGLSEGSSATGRDIWKVNSEFDGYIEKDVPKEALEELRVGIHAVRVADIHGFDFSTLPQGRGREKKVFMKEEVEIKKYVGDYIGYIVRGKTIAEAWLKILDTILKFGKESDTHYDEDQREVVNLLSVIEEEDPNNFYIPEYLPCDEKRVREYIPRITRDMRGDGTYTYTYGSRMRSWFGTDQVQRALEKLTKKPISRAVVINLWDSQKDLEIGGSPCLNHIWFRVSGGRIHMTCIVRSQDMFEGYPENCFGLRAFQEEFRKSLSERLKAKGGGEVSLGSMVLLTQSCHLYKDTWEWAKQVTEKELPKYMKHMSRLDPRGNFIVSHHGDEIMLEHTTPSGEKIGHFHAKTAEELRNILTNENVISLIPHAFDLGMEVKKAEIALKMGVGYNQDQELDLGDKPTVENRPEVKEDGMEADYIVKRVIKEGIKQSDYQNKEYPKILSSIRLDSFIFH